MRKLFNGVLLILTFSSYSQIRGLVTDEQNVSIPSVNIYMEGTYTNTSSNENGNFEFDIREKGNYTLVFKYIGFKIKKVTIDVQKFPYEVNVKLIEENVELKEVVITNKDNPANQIIRNAIASKKLNTERTAAYTADFYSKGLIRIKDAPKKILGQDVGDFGGAIDSTRTGILYLSETISKLKFKKPDKMKETIIASKVSGNDNGFSFNNAASVEYDFYENYLPFEVNIVSPLSDGAFSYYKFKIEGSFFNEDNQQINKIKIVPRRDTEPVVEGYIYIVENSWAIYAVDVVIKGYRMQMPVLEKLELKQNFSYNSIDNIWTKNTQSIDFIAGILGFNFSGRFTHVYSKFEFEPKFDKKTFNKEILVFEKDANKKEDDFWNLKRPIPLSLEESLDYRKKDSIQIKRKSKVYLDSIDKKSNKFSLSDILMGYNYKNTFKQSNFNYAGFISSLRFNTVQGFNLSTNFSYTKRDPDKKTYIKFETFLNYGFEENKWRVKGDFTKKFNNLNNAFLKISLGNDIVQFNEEKPISTIINSVSTLFFKDNYMKLYDKLFAKLFYQQEIVNGIFVFSSLEYNKRSPLFNTTDYTFIKNDEPYTSNNPLKPFDYITPAIDSHRLIKGSITGKINFAQEYWTRPDGKYNFSNSKYPTIFLTYEKAFGGSKKNLNFDYVQAKLKQELDLKNKGLININLKAGQFFNGKNISFIDYHHFNGNQTRIGQTDSYLNVFNLMPYYSNSTNDSFLEIHSEYNDKGFLVNKIPLINQLKVNMVLGYHQLSIPIKKPYQEFSVGLDNLGFGKLKFFRLDYVRAYQSGFQSDGIIFGFKFLNALD